MSQRRQWLSDILIHRPSLLILLTVLGSVSVYTAIHLFFQLPYALLTGMIISAVIPVVVGAPMILFTSYLTREVEEQRRRLTELNGQKDILLSLLAHDMRSPLAMLKQSLDLASESGDPEDAQFVLPHLHSQVADTLGLLDNLLQWTRVQFTAEQESDVINVLENILQVVAPQREVLERKQIQLHMDVSSEHHIEINKDLLNLIMGNLLSNAIKYTPAHGQITISTRIDAQHILLKVADTGVGMSAEQLQSLFSMRPLTSEPGVAGERGGGVGLMLCTQLLQSIDGRLWAESEPGQGSCFYLQMTLPTQARKTMKPASKSLNLEENV